MERKKLKNTGNTDSVMMSESLIERVDLTEFYQGSVGSKYSLSINIDEKYIDTKVQHLSFDGEKRKYTFSISDASEIIHCLVSSKQILNIDIFHAEGRILNIDGEDISSIKFDAQLVGNSESLKLSITTSKDI